jgi:hypothetical protein
VSAKRPQVHYHWLLDHAYLQVPVQAYGWAAPGDVQGLSTASEGSQLLDRPSASAIEPTGPRVTTRGAAFFMTLRHLVGLTEMSQRSSVGYTAYSHVLIATKHVSSTYPNLSTYRDSLGVSVAVAHRNALCTEYANMIALLRFAGFGAAMLVLAACMVSPGRSYIQTGPDEVEQFRAAVREAVNCRTAAARNQRYAGLDVRMPLADIAEASLPQMIDPHLATSDEIATLDGWTRDVGACRDRLLPVTYATLPSFGPIIEQARDNDDAVYVMITQHKLTWGQGVMRLKVNQTELRAALIARTDQLIVRIGNAQEQERNRRTTILSSVIRILP